MLRKFIGLFTILTVLIIIVGCEEKASDEDVKLQLEQQEAMHLEEMRKQIDLHKKEKEAILNENEALKQELDMIIQQSKEMLMVDPTMNPDVLIVLFQHFYAIKERNESKYNLTLLHPDNTNSSWTWNLVKDSQMTYTVRRLSNFNEFDNGWDDSYRATFMCEFDAVDGDSVKPMNPTFMLMKTDDGWKIYDID